MVAEVPLTGLSFSAMRHEESGAVPGRKTIRLRPCIAWLGTLPWGVAAAPGAIGCIMLVCRPDFILEHPIGAAFCLAQGVGFGWLAYRWLTIRGTADPQEMYLRGWLRTLVVPTASVAAVRRIETETWNDVGSSRKAHDVLVDHDGHTLGTIPAALAICPEWQPFLAHVRRLAAASRSCGPTLGEQRPLADIPVAKWTRGDIARYERRG
jgi:hypothetical protein